MLRRLLACLALFTGLAAVGAPAEARLVASASAHLITSAPAAEVKRSVPCARQDRRQPGACFDTAAGRPRDRRPVVIYLPTIQLGADRSLE